MGGVFDVSIPTQDALKDTKDLCIYSSFSAERLMERSKFYTVGEESLALDSTRSPCREIFDLWLESLHRNLKGRLGCSIERMGKLKLGNLSSVGRAGITQTQCLSH